MDILWLLVSVATGALYAGWFGMRLEKRYDAALWLFRLAPLPLVPMDVVWATTTSESLAMRLAVAALIGALAGATIMISASESFRWWVTGAEAQTRTSPPEGGNTAPPAPSNPSGGGGIYAPDNKGIIAPDNKGTVTQNNYVNKDPRAWGFTPDQWNAFSRSLLPSSQHIFVLVRLDDDLAEDFRNQLLSLINSVPGWEARDFGTATKTLHARGIIIRVPDANKPPPEAQNLMNAFLASGIQPTPIFAGGAGIQIIIGSPPR
jgi:hypothetical protein